jgi:hypothetical protein
MAKRTHMPNLNDRGGVAVGGAPSWCMDPEHCDSSPAKVKQCGKCRNVPHLPAAESSLAAGSRSMWVYYPQGILRRPVLESDLPATRPVRSISVHSHECRAGLPEPDHAESAPYPGHSLYQDSFLFCKFKKIGDAHQLADVYVETIVDGCTGLAFAKVYSAEGAWNAADIFQTRVAPFFARHGVPIEQVITTGAEEYCGIPPIHPFEAFLAASGIRHARAQGSGESHSPLCAQLFAVLQHEFLAPALRGKFEHTLESLQQELDHFLTAYNSARPSLAPGMHGRPPLRAFLETARAL